MSIPFEDIIEKEILSKDVINLLPRTCYCGKPLYFSDSVRSLRCVNSDCIQYTSERVHKLLKKLNIEASINECKSIVQSLSIVTPYQIFMLPKAYESKLISKSEVHSIKSLTQNIKNAINKEYLIYEIVNMCGIETVEKVAYKLFKGFKSVLDAYMEIDTRQISFINERLGVSESDSAIISVDIYNKLVDLKEELIFAETQLNVKNEETENLRIAVAGNIEPYLNKSELFEYIENTYGVNCCLVTNINDNTDILISISDSTSSKARVAKLINERYADYLIKSGSITKNDIGKQKENSLKPIGSKIYIGTLENVLERLDTIYLKDSEVLA